MTRSVAWAPGAQPCQHLGACPDSVQFFPLLAQGPPPWALLRSPSTMPRELGSLRVQTGGGAERGGRGVPRPPCPGAPGPSALFISPAASFLPGPATLPKGSLSEEGLASAYSNDVVTFNRGRVFSPDRPRYLRGGSAMRGIKASLLRPCPTDSASVLNWLLAWGLRPLGPLIPAEALRERRAIRKLGPEQTGHTMPRERERLAVIRQPPIKERTDLFERRRVVSVKTRAPLPYLKLHGAGAWG